MKNASDVELCENVISVSFREVAHDIAHPASKNFPLEQIDDDPLESLLSEGEEDLESKDLEISDNEDENYIHAHQNSWSYEFSMKNTPIELATNLQEQMKRLKEDVKRLKYYLDEINIK